MSAAAADRSCPNAPRPCACSAPTCAALAALALAMACAAVVALASAAFAKLLEPAFNEVLIAADPRACWSIPLAIVGVALVRGLAQVGQATLVNRVGHGVVGRLQVELFGGCARGPGAAAQRPLRRGAVGGALRLGLVREAATTGVINYVQHGLTVSRC
jgi:subfamily B ATP-binding cassette protein MsbA